MKRNKKNGFTLVELLAVIVILAIILVIAVPKVMSVIEDSKKATLESTAKMIASSAEKAKVQNTVLGKDTQITCDSVAKINKLDYDTCDIDFDDNTAKVTIKGKGKFAGLSVCNGTKTTASATDQSCPIPYGDGDTYITKLLAQESQLHNGLVQTSATYTNEDSEEIKVDAGIRYVGPLTGNDAVKNQVYFNCEPTDGENVYGSKNYNYKDSCEIWRIIGVFDVEDGEGNKSSRIKIINTSSTFTASWDSSASDVNDGFGVNQWGPSTLTDSSAYAGADLMQLLNGYYIGKPNSECKYNNSKGQSGLSQTCDTIDAPLSSKNMRPLTSIAKGQISEAKWYTYAPNGIGGIYVSSSYSNEAYLLERGITQKYTGCRYSQTAECSLDSVKRNNQWVGLVGLMSLSDMTYANGWLYDGSLSPWSISPRAGSSDAKLAWQSNSDKSNYNNASNALGVWPAVYLSSNVQIIGGDGTDGNAYKLSVGEQ